MLHFEKLNNLVGMLSFKEGVLQPTFVDYVTMVVRMLYNSRAAGGG